MFGATMLWAGFRRLSGVDPVGTRASAFLWGTIGILLGATMLVIGGMFAWKLLPMNEPPSR